MPTSATATATTSNITGYYLVILSPMQRLVFYQNQMHKENRIEGKRECFPGIITF